MKQNYITVMQENNKKNIEIGKNNLKRTMLENEISELQTQLNGEKVHREELEERIDMLNREKSNIEHKMAELKNQNHQAEARILKANSRAKENSIIAGMFVRKIGNKVGKVVGIVPARDGRCILIKSTNGEILNYPMELILEETGNQSLRNGVRVNLEKDGSAEIIEVRHPEPRSVRVQIEGNKEEVWPIDKLQIVIQ